MRTSTILFIFLLVMHLLTVLNTLLFGGNLNDLVFWFNSALFMAALAVFVYRAAYSMPRKHLRLILPKNANDLMPSAMPQYLVKHHLK